MAARRRQRRPFDPHYWLQVRVAMFCARGGHTVEPGQWMRYLKNDHRRLGSCETCLAQVGISRPTRPFTFKKDAPADVRARQTGGDE